MVQCLGQEFVPGGSFMAGWREQETGPELPRGSRAELGTLKAPFPFCAAGLYCVPGPCLVGSVDGCGRSDSPPCLLGGLSLRLGSSDGRLDLGWEGREASDGWTQGHSRTMDWALC